MTLQERQNLLTGPFDQLYEKAHSTHKEYEFYRAQRAYKQLSQPSPSNPSMTWEDHMRVASDTHWTETEWGFPKGRREKNESEMECAFREFREETGICLSPNYLIHNMAQFHEMFTGTDHQVYKHVYYMVHIPWEMSNLSGLPKETEIEEARWVSFSTGMNLIRNYQHSRRVLFQHIHDFIQTHPIFII
jgi:8-oxo-dGTP pyrophosphatase MutT (NUDIX family)